jgi:anti-sigma B factor antagonist
VLHIEIHDEGSHVLCRPVGDLDAFSVHAFREALTSMIQSPRLLIDLSEVPFMDSSGLGALIGGIRRVREAEGEVAVACSRPTLARLLHTTGFDRIVPVAANVDEALLALRERPGDVIS